MPLLATKQTKANFAQIVFILFTTLYQLKTLMLPSRIQHKSPVYGQFRKAFS
jgi:hypothetical protein